MPRYPFSLSLSLSLASSTRPQYRQLPAAAWAREAATPSGQGIKTGLTGLSPDHTLAQKKQEPLMEGASPLHPSQQQQQHLQQDQDDAPVHDISPPPPAPAAATDAAAAHANGGNPASSNQMDLEYANQVVRVDDCKLPSPASRSPPRQAVTCLCTRLRSDGVHVLAAEERESLTTLPHVRSARRRGFRG